MPLADFADLQGSAEATPEALQAASDAVLKASRDLDKLSQSGDASTEALKTAFHNLGVVSQTSLQQSIKDAQKFFDDIKAGSDQSAAGLADVANAFLASAKKQLAAAAQLDSGTQQTTKASLENQAAALGLVGALKDIEAQSAKTGSSLSTDAERYSASLKQLGAAADARRKAFEDAGNAANYAADQTEKVGKAAQDATTALDDTGASAADLNQQIQDIGTGGFPDLSQALANTRAEFLGVSDAAAKAFDTKLLSDFETAFDATGAGFSKVIEGMNEASASVTQQNHRPTYAAAGRNREHQPDWHRIWNGLRSVWR